MYIYYIRKVSDIPVFDKFMKNKKRNKLFKYLTY